MSEFGPLTGSVNGQTQGDVQGHDSMFNEQYVGGQEDDNLITKKGQ
jgi:hypothetical protein